MLDALAASVAGSILCLDRICLQMMISRPVVTGVIIGWLLQDPYAGLITGAMVELLWVDRSQIGVSIPPNDTLASVTITAATIFCGRSIGSTPQDLMALAVLLLIPVGLLGRQMDVMIAQANERLSMKALDDAARGDAGAVSRRHVIGTVRAIIFSFLFLAGSILIATEILLVVYTHAPSNILMSLRVLYDFILILGMAVAINTMNLRGAVPILCGIFLAITLLFDFL